MPLSRQGWDLWLLAFGFKGKVRQPSSAMCSTHFLDLAEMFTLRCRSALLAQPKSRVAATNKHTRNVEFPAFMIYVETAGSVSLAYTWPQQVLAPRKDEAILHDLTSLYEVGFIFLVPPKRTPNLYTHRFKKEPYIHSPKAVI